VTGQLSGHRRRTVGVRYQVTLPQGGGSPISLWLPVPQSDEHQEIADLRFSGSDSHTIQGGRDHNRYFFTQASAGQTVAMEFQVIRSERRAELQPAPVRPIRPTCCLGSDRLVPLDRRIRSWAEDVVRSARARTDMEKARAIYEHVIDTVKYDKSGHGWGKGDIYYACDTRRGNCSDFHAIFIGYTRAVGIPAKFVVGLPFPRERGAGEIAGYHCWAEFFAKDIGWVPIDASEAAKDPSRRKYFFGALDENRVALTQGRDLILTPRQAGAPLNFLVYPYAELGGQEIGDLTFRLFYQDVR
jgi:transglutaminase-like putative cysteine protease